MTIAEKIKQDYGEVVLERIEISNVCVLKDVHCCNCKYRDETLATCIHFALQEEWKEGGTNG